MKKSDFDLSRQNQSIESRIVASLERISQAFRTLLWQESKEHALSPIQVQVLIFIHFHSPEKCKVSYLADEFTMTKATISETIKTLEQKKLIRKEFEPEDTRSFTIQLTSKGKKIAEKTALFTQEVFTPIDRLIPSDKETMLLSLLGIIRHLDKAGIITIQRMCGTCVYYQASHNGTRHFCSLLNQKLEAHDLRLDCPEHVLKD